MKNKYEKEMEQLKDDVRNEYDKYKNQASSIDEEIRQNMNRYDANIGIINSMRHELRIEIRKLCDFLKGLGDIGRSIDIFEFLTEDLAKSNNVRLIDVNFDDYEVPERTNVPVIGNIPWIGSGVNFIRQRSRDKKDYMDMVQEFEKLKLQLDVDLNKRKSDIKFYGIASEIANNYRAIIAMVKDTIDMTIIPELDGIEAFLVAASIKESIISNEDPHMAKPVKIGEFKGTLFHCHYIFVENCHDYYSLIKEFFTKKFLTDIVADREITQEERLKIAGMVETMEKETERIKNATIFGGVK